MDSRNTTLRFQKNRFHLVLGSAQSQPCEGWLSYKDDFLKAQ